jgi:murein DD-endopeptidase MepM/ murein hydrolase activator NlpD
MRNSVSVVLLGLLALSVNARGEELPASDPVPGGVAVVELGPQQISRPLAHFQKQRVMVVRSAGHWYAVVGLSLGLKAGTYAVHCDDAGDYPFRITTKTYPSQYIKLANKLMVDPTPEDLKRILSDQRALRRAFAAWSDVDEPPLRLDLPVPGRLTGAFGVRRFFNGEPRQPHSGLDLAAPVGTPVTAPAAGVVIETGNYYFNGNTILLDHGQGLVTMYNHLSRVAVRPGMHVERGQLLGNVGMTGRVTGPHLHWSVSLNDTRINPALLLKGTALARLTELESVRTGRSARN